MLDYTEDRFKVDVPLLHKGAYDKFCVYKQGEVICKNQSFDEFLCFTNSIQGKPPAPFKSQIAATAFLQGLGYIVEKIEQPDRYKTAQRVYYAAVNEKIAQWKKDLSEHYGIDFINDPIGKIIFEKAWNECHSDGYQQVDSEIEDLLEFVESVMKSISQFSQSKLMEMGILKLPK